jgi:hypothetical protein
MAIRLGDACASAPTLTQRLFCLLHCGMASVSALAPPLSAFVCARAASASSAIGRCADSVGAMGGAGAQLAFTSQADVRKKEGEESCNTKAE